MHGLKTCWDLWLTPDGCYSQRSEGGYLLGTATGHADEHWWRFLEGWGEKSCVILLGDMGERMGWQLRELSGLRNGREFHRLKERDRSPERRGC